jgi:hypothetical protein
MILPLPLKEAVQISTLKIARLEIAQQIYVVQMVNSNISRLENKSDSKTQTSKIKLQLP